MSDEYPTPAEMYETSMVVTLTAYLIEDGSQVNSVQVGDRVARWIVFTKPRHDWAKALSLATDILAVIAERIDSLGDKIEDGAEPLVILGQGDYTTTIQAPPPIAAKVRDFNAEMVGDMDRHRAAVPLDRSEIFAAYAAIETLKQLLSQEPGQGGAK